MKKLLILITISFAFIISIFLFSILFTSCKKERGKETIIEPATGKEIRMEINRFEDILFGSNQQNLKTHLQANYENYKPLFNTTLDNVEYFAMIEQFATDPNMIEAYKQVKKRYPNLDWLSNDITKAFSILLKEFPETKIPKIYSLMLGPAEFSYSYSQRVIAQKDFMTFAIDLYSINSLQDNKYYNHFPKYIIQMLDSTYIAPDMLNLYLQNVITPTDIPIMQQSLEATLCDIIIERGKYIYVLTKILPDYSLNSFFRYNEAQMKWVEDNEYNIWSLIVQNGLLYSKDRPKYMHLINEAPTTKGINNSPSRLGDYIGYRIVEKYMKENRKTIKELILTKDSKEIMNKSAYKPKRS